MSIKSSASGNTKRITERYGGRFGRRGDLDKPLFWFHSSKTLRDLGVGIPIGKLGTGIWECTSQSVQDALKDNLAAPNDFLAVRGFHIWQKGNTTCNGRMTSWLFDSCKLGVIVKSLSLTFILCSVLLY